MADTILLVFEGERTEPRIFDNLRKTFFGSEVKSVVHATYNAEIYQLWQRVKDDGFLDLIELLRERSAKNRKSLEGIERDQVSQIFLFFDYEGHATGATDEKIQKMLEHFDEETENGKLYISYPMVEALKHLTPDFQNQTVPAKQNINYKQMVAESSSPYQDMRKVDANDWNHIISENLKKGNFIASGQYALPKSPDSQPEIFEGQLTNYIRPLNQITVLSGIPFFVVEYFGIHQIWK
ncbi:MAG: hypothetical protein DRP64_01020 [Verrucomicrobia bacterium]|nr:MAG: hypothetical protein DRP64_01020 [Verrucomicrobiota bacterium]